MSRDEFHGSTPSSLAPFGVELTATPSTADPRLIPPDSFKRLVDENGVVVLRGFAPLLEDDFPDFCHRFGELQEWDFGVVNKLRVDAEAKNYLYTSGAVPFHWDGAFAGRIPHYIIFHCDMAPGRGGGETLFCDTVRLLKTVPAKLLNQWRRVKITYTTEKVVHYGGTFTSPLIAPHPENGKEILRFAEPVLDLNPVRLKIDGLTDSSETAFLEDMHERLVDEAVCYAHTWRSGDVVIADNYVLLHGRRGFAQGAERQIRRVNVF
jgi:alpha-ketoglutarate-dependent taurine dioxygenase